MGGEGALGHPDDGPRSGQMQQMSVDQLENGKTLDFIQLLEYLE